MSKCKSIHLSRISDFRKAYKLLNRNGLIDTTPIIFCEGDSWFSTPLSMNLLDQLVFPTPEDERAGRVIFGKGGLFFRVAKSGDTAINMFQKKRSKRLAKWIGSSLFKFDLVLLSAGGNDFVANFLKDLFKEKNEMKISDALEIVDCSNQYQHVFDAYQLFIDEVNKIRPNIPIIAHTYDYPQLMGQEGELTLTNIGLIAFFKKRIGDWISKNIDHVIKDKSEQKEFAKCLIDRFTEIVLKPLAHQNEMFSYIDLRRTISNKSYWFDEMHPNDEGFYKLAQKLKQPILSNLPPNKRN